MQNSPTYKEEDEIAKHCSPSSHENAEMSKREHCRGGLLMSFLTKIPELELRPTPRVTKITVYDGNVI